MDFKRMGWWLPFGRVPEIDAPAFHAQLQNRPPPLVLDVRSALEWNNSHIAGSINIPVTDLKACLAMLPSDKAQPIVAVCRSARRSIPAVRFLKQRGFAQVCQLKGGMRAWWQANLPVDGEKGE